MAIVWKAQSVQYSRGTYWNIRSRLNGKRINLSLGYVTEDEAARAAEQMTLEERMGRSSRVREWHKEDRESAVRYLVGDPGADELIEGKIDYARMPLRQYFAEGFGEWRAKEAAGSWRSERRLWDRLLEDIGDVELQRIDAHVVADFLDTLMVSRGPRKGLPLSGNSKRLYRSAIKAVLKRAFRLKHVPVLADLAVFTIKGSTQRVVEKPDPLSLEELVELMGVSTPKYRAMWATGGGQGLRPSELARIRWEDVNLKRKTLLVRGRRRRCHVQRCR